MTLPSPHIVGVACTAERLPALMKDGALLELEEDRFESRGEAVGATAVALTDGGDLVLAFASGRERREVRSGRVVERREVGGAAVMDLSVDPGGRSFASAGWDGVLRLFELVR